MQRILIVRLSAIGDVVMATSLIAPLRRAWPEARIYWLTEEAGYEILRGNGDLAEVIVAPRRRWRKLWRERHYATVAREVWALIRKLRGLRPDLAIDAQGLLRSGIWTRLSGAPRRLGIGSKEGSQVWMHTVVPPERDVRGRMCHEYRRGLEVLGLPDCLELGLHPTAEAATAADAQLAGLPLPPVFLFPFTTRPQKHWFDERWAELARRIVEETGHPVWILGGPGDEAHAHAIAQAAAIDGIEVVAGPSSDLQQKMALIERGAGAVGVDTGLTHMSLGLRTPTVVLFGSTCGYTDTRPLPGMVLYSELPCSPCRRHPTCNGAFTCMRDHSVDNVLRALTGLLHPASTLK